MWAVYELIQMLIDRNNLHDIDTWMFFKWIFKTAAAILILSNTFNIVNAIFDVSQSVIASSAGVIQGSTDISPDMLADLEATLETMGLGSLLGLWLQSIFIGFTMTALNIVIFVLIYGRMLEIYMLTSLAPIPVATLSNREMGSMGQNYLKSLFAIGFQGLLILLCVGIYAVLIQGIATGGDPIAQYGEPWAIRFCSALCCSKPGQFQKASLERIKERGVICREDMGPAGRACGTEKRRRTLTRRMLPALWRKQKPFCKSGNCWAEGMTQRRLPGS